MTPTVVQFTLPSTDERWNWPIDGDDTLSAFIEILDLANISWVVATTYSAVAGLSDVAQPPQPVDALLDDDDFAILADENHTRTHGADTIYERVLHEQLHNATAGTLTVKHIDDAVTSLRALADFLSKHAPELAHPSEALAVARAHTPAPEEAP